MMQEVINILVLGAVTMRLVHGVTALARAILVLLDNVFMAQQRSKFLQ